MAIVAAAVRFGERPFPFVLYCCGERGEEMRVRENQRGHTENERETTELGVVGFGFFFFNEEEEEDGDDGGG